MQLDYNGKTARAILSNIGINDIGTNSSSYIKAVNKQKISIAMGIFSLVFGMILLISILQHANEHYVSGDKLLFEVVLLFITMIISISSIVCSAENLYENKYFSNLESEIEAKDPMFFRKIVNVYTKNIELFKSYLIQLDDSIIESEPLINDGIHIINKKSKEQSSFEDGVKSSIVIEGCKNANYVPDFVKISEINRYIEEKYLSQK